MKLDKPTGGITVKQIQGEMRSIKSRLLKETDSDKFDKLKEQLKAKKEEYDSMISQLK